jgi:GNAT superfamily N-acetyltransferase
LRIHVADSINIRLATTDDEPVLHQLIAISVRGLMNQDYTAAQLDQALGTLLGLDTQLIADGTYFVAETVQEGKPIAVACGGWSKRETLFGSDHVTGRDSRLLDPAKEAARIRAFFVHPEWVRRGIGSRILDACEQAAITAAFQRLEMGATLSGVPLYKSRGYVQLEQIEVPMGDGQTFTVVRMGKSVNTGQ